MLPPFQTFVAYIVVVLGAYLLTICVAILGPMIQVDAFSTLEAFRFLGYACTPALSPLFFLIPNEEWINIGPCILVMLLVIILFGIVWARVPLNFGSHAKFRKARRKRNIAVGNSNQEEWSATCFMYLGIVLFCAINLTARGVLACIESQGVLIFSTTFGDTKMDTETGTGLYFTCLGLLGFFNFLGQPSLKQCIHPLNGMRFSLFMTAVGCGMISTLSYTYCISIRQDVVITTGANHSRPSICLPLLYLLLSLLSLLMCINMLIHTDQSSFSVLLPKSHVHVSSYLCSSAHLIYFPLVPSTSSPVAWAISAHLNLLIIQYLGVNSSWTGLVLTWSICAPMISTVTSSSFSIIVGDKKQGAWMGPHLITHTYDDDNFINTKKRRRQCKIGNRE